MDEQFGTWMDWIWSSMCLALLCTFTQSNNIKWVSGGAINIPMHLKTRWLRTLKTVELDEPMLSFQGHWFIRCPYPHHLAVEVLWQNWSDVIQQWCVRSSGAKGLLTKTSVFVSSRPSDRPTLPLTKASVHPVLKSLSWHVSMLIQTRHQIDRRYPHLYYRIIWCYYLLQHCSFQSSDAIGM
jgi:hypothetical protein